MGDANERRIAEAKECEKKALEHLKTSIWKMKTKPEYDSAASEYDRAAVCYKNAEKLDLCKQMYLKAAECHGNNKNLFHEAKCKESAAMIARDEKNMKEAGKLFKEAAEGFLYAGVMDTAAMTIDKAAKMMEMSEPDVAVELYEFGLTLVQQADRSKMAMGFSHRLIKLLLRAENYVKAKEVSRDLIEKYKEVSEFPKIGQIVVGMVIMSLIQGDPIEALKQLYFLPDQGNADFSDERNLCNNIVTSYENGDEEKLQTLLTRPYIKCMDNDYLRIVKHLHVPESKRRKPAAEGGGAMNDEEFDENDLC
jgi:tetratricopeptide (TPR) repeat protein